jgi:hypothetical protein
MIDPFCGSRMLKARNIDVLYYSKHYRPPTHYWANAIIWLQIWRTEFEIRVRRS